MLHHVRAINDAPKRAPAAPKSTAGELYGKLINLSGRRRFTSQRVVLYAVLASQGDHRQARSPRARGGV